MTLCALGIAEELRGAGIASNTLWPRTLVAVTNLLGGGETMARARKPQVYSDAACAILTRPAAPHTGHSVLCVDVLVESGVTDLSVYDHSATR
jgi:citronellol/citronellal dehydrogenase